MHLMDETSSSEACSVAKVAQQEAETYCERLPLHLCHGCDGCGMRCTEGVKITYSEYVRIARFLHEHPDDSERVQAQDKSIPGWPITQFCQFRDTELDRCSIYPVRPVICRLFGHTEWLPCPLELVPLQGTEAMDLYQQYAQEKLQPFDEWRREAECGGESRCALDDRP